jgi:hypothetical protein
MLRHEITDATVARESAARSAPADEFKSEVLDALRGSIPQEPYLHPINLLKDFLEYLERDSIMVRCTDDPDSYREFLADVRLMQEQLAAINAAEPVPAR